MTGAIQQVGTQQIADIRHHFRRANGVKPMAAEIDGNAVDDEAPGIAADMAGPFENRDVFPACP